MRTGDGSCQRERIAPTVNAWHSDEDIDEDIRKQRAKVNLTPNLKNTMCLSSQDESKFAGAFLRAEAIDLAESLNTAN